MQATVEKLPQSEVRLTVTVPVAEAEKRLADAVRRLSERTPFEGFRPGKAPHDVVAAKLGEMAIWQEAAEDIIKHAYARAVIDNKLQPIGSPAIDLKSLAPGNPVEFTATVTVLPAVLSLPDLSALRVEPKEATVGDKDVDAAIGELQRMQTKETEVERPATKADKVTMDITIERDRVAVEGGQAKNHGVYLSEPYYIPGFTDEIVGLKKGDEKTFTLSFPKEHYQKQLAGQPADFRVKVQSVHELASPPLDDAFAKTLGQSSLTELRALLRKNMETEAAEKETQRQEAAALEALVTDARFEDIPAKLINAEAEKMTHELEHSIAERGLEFDEYLKNIKKTREEIKLGFAPEAAKRIKTILALRALADREGIAVDDAEVAREIEATMNQYADDPEAQKQIRSEEYESTVRTMLRNRKTIEYLRDRVVRKQ